LFSEEKTIMDEEFLTAVNKNDLSEVKRLIKKGC
jgi:hypothetical protein